ncbi:unnamed protein product [Didymodactylos carnosus]|uniref:Uncharacterized protein n=1 Tax=Didymodactylos carnosus TaxID=1234261 RepID=A0A814JTZ7_9BILA|nr:unnamed protein product [Didymodactylos carnosus]CAF3812207.1 unnamed protein product [Didymodactylos carnosus]
MNVHTAKKPTISSSFYDSYTNKPVKWYEIVDAYRQYTETYLPIRLDNYPQTLLKNLKGFFSSTEKTEVIDDINPVNEIQQTRPDGNIIKVTEYDLKGEKFDSRISDAVRTHSSKKLRSSSKRARSRHQTMSPPRRSYSHTRQNSVSPTFSDCPECLAAARANSYICNCSECRNKRSVYPNQKPFCDCYECRQNRKVSQ